MSFDYPNKIKAKETKFSSSSSRAKRSVLDETFSRAKRSVLDETLVSSSSPLLRKGSMGEKEHFVLFDYQQICRELLKDLSKKQQEIISCRFVLSDKTCDKGGIRKETLESIGNRFGITRERVRQIEKEGMAKIKPKLKKQWKVFQYFTIYFQKIGGLKREDILLEHLGKEKYKQPIYFLLTLDQSFKRYGESSDFYYLWTIDEKSLILAKKVINFFLNKLKKIKKPLTLKELGSFPGQELKTDFLISCLEVSKKIQQNAAGLFGLKDWPEINPKGIKDRAYLTLKENNIPLHFNQIASLISKNALPQTVHNELIKDQRFVLVGRGIYGLKDWGYYPGDVKEVIFKSLEEVKRPLTREEVLEKVLKQRLVKESTILLNLSNRKYFLKTNEGKYKIREA